LFAEVLVNIVVRQVDKTFLYAVPEELENKVQIGARVKVPFGRRAADGYVVGLNSDQPAEKVKEITAVLDHGPLFTPSQLALARWMAAYYLRPTVEAMQVVIGPRLKATVCRKLKEYWPVKSDNTEISSSLLLTPKQTALWQVALTNPGLSRTKLAALAGVSSGLIDVLVKKGLLSERVYTGPAGTSPLDKTPKNEVLVLNPNQKAASGLINTAIQAKNPEVFLLHGITDSGKTEVYLQCVQQVISLGGQAIILVPEIALTPQMVDIFYARFGSTVAILHSRLSAGERFNDWNRVQSGEARVILGTRSAIFAPVTDLRLVVIDEEHEPSYKQEENPRYHARTVALRLAKQYQAVVVLGSATPSLYSYSRALSGGPFRLSELSHRVDRRPLPEIRIIDMRQEAKGGNRHLFSQPLQEAIQDRLNKKEQIILFLNRRGYATFVFCRACGLVMKCPHCNISLCYHANNNLICHYCNYLLPAPSLCPDCQEQYLGYFGAGTQKIEKEITLLFPQAKVLRLDKDTVSRKNAHRQIIMTFQEGEADILIGTQMVAKGLDIPGVTLVGVINADITLHMPDFRASERTFQLLMQVAGRAGRSSKGGEVLVQTYSPQHYAIVAAQKQVYLDFFRQEMMVRRKMNYPPFTRLCRLVLSGTDPDIAAKAAGELGAKLKLKALNLTPLQEEQIEILGPVMAPLAKIKDHYRWHLILKAKEITILRAAAQIALNWYEEKTVLKRKVKLVVDLDPQNMM